MAQLKGKQIADKTVSNKQIADDAISTSNIIDSTVNQAKLNLTSPLIDSDASTKKYTDELVVSSISIERSSDTNLSMTAEDTAATALTDGISVACLTPVLIDSVVNTVVEVYINGVKCNVGSGKECFFSPDGEIVRKVNDVRIGDKLYWNSYIASYDLDENDVIDFKFLTNNKQVEEAIVAANETYIVNSDVTLLKYTGVETNAEEANVSIDGEVFRISYTYVVDTWYFNFGFTHPDEHIFTEIDESHDIIVNGELYTIRWSGVGSTFITITKQGLTDNSYGPQITSIKQILIDNGLSPVVDFDSRGDWLFVASEIDDELIIFKRVNNTYELYQRFTGHTTIKSRASKFEKSGTLLRYLLFDDTLYVYDYNTSLEVWEETDLNTINPDPGHTFIYKNDLYFIFGNIIRHYIFNGSAWLTNGDIAEAGFVTKYQYEVVDDTNMIVTSDLGFLRFTKSGSDWSYSETLTLGYGLTLTDIEYLVYDDNYCFSSNGEFFTYTNFKTGENAILIFEMSGYTQVGYFLVTALKDLNSYIKATCPIDNNGKIYVPIVQNNDPYTGDPNVLFITETFIFEYVNSTWTRSENLPSASFTITDTTIADETGSYLIYDKMANRLFSTELASAKSIYEYGESFVTNYPTDRTIQPIASALKLEENTENDSYYIDYTYSHPIGIDEILPTVEWKIADHFHSFNTLSPTINNITVKAKSELDLKVVDYKLKPNDANKITGDSATGIFPNGILIADNDNIAFGSTQFPVGPLFKVTIISGTLQGNGPGIYYLQAEGVEQSKDYSTAFLTQSSLSMSIYMEIRPSVSAYSAVFFMSDGSTTTGTSITGSTSVGDFDSKSLLFKQYTIGSCTFTIEEAGGFCPLLRDERT